MHSRVTVIASQRLHRQASKRRHRQKLPRAQWNQRPHRQKCKASSDPTPEITILFAQGTAKFVLFPKAFRFFSELKGLPSSYCSLTPSGIFTELKGLPSSYSSGFFLSSRDCQVPTLPSCFLRFFSELEGLASSCCSPMPSGIFF